LLTIVPLSNNATQDNGRDAGIISQNLENLTGR